MRFTPWLSVRQLAGSPWARLWLVALVLVQIIAPSWHVCEMGGNAAHCAKPMAGMKHGFMLASAGTGATTERRAVICACRDEAEKPALSTDRLDANPAADCHQTCLAMLLQSMPGQYAVSIELFGFGVVHPTRQAVHTYHFVPAPQHRLRGRAPPVLV